MSDLPIESLPTLTVPSSDDVFVVVDSPSGTPVTKQITFANLNLAASINLTTQVTGTLPVSNGGIGAATLTGFLFGSGTSAITGISSNGTGNVVLTTSASLVTPTLGVALATSINGLIISTTTGTLTLANGSTLVTSGGNSITLTSTGSTNVTLPTTGTLITLAGSETLTNKTITDSTNNVMAKSLKSATTTVDVSAATAPTSGQVLTATSTTAATWQSTQRLSSFVGSFTRDMTAASGNVAYTGVGFTPTSLHIYGFTGTTSDTRGFSDSAKNANGINRNGTTIYQVLSAYGANTVLSLDVGGGAYQYATISSYDSDGFTLSWTKVGSPTGTGSLAYIAYK